MRADAWPRRPAISRNASSAASSLTATRAAGCRRKSCRSPAAAMSSSAMRTVSASAIGAARGRKSSHCRRAVLRAATMTQFDLTDDQRQIQEMAQKFTADAITPFAAEWDEKHIFPRDTIKSAAELGFASIYVAEESGGIGLGRLEAALIMEAMAYGCPSTSAFISIHNMASWMIDRFGAQALKDKYLPSLIPME